MSSTAERVPTRITSEQVDMEFLRQEYFHLQDTVESFDEKALTIKAWSVTVSMAGIGAAFVEKLPSLLILASGASLLFWLVEASWKTFQQANYHRLRTIESFMRGKVPLEEFRLPDITGAWSVGWRKTKLIRIMLWTHVFLPHAVVMAFGIGAWVANRFLHFIPE